MISPTSAATTSAASSATARLRTFAVIAAFVLLGMRSGFGQSMPGYQASGKPKVKEESVQTKAARGQAPGSQALRSIKTGRFKNQAPAGIEWAVATNNAVRTVIIEVSSDGW